MNLISFVEHLATFPDYLLEAALRSLAVACVAGFIIAAIAGKRPALRLYIWTAVLYVALAMPALNAFLPAMKIAVPGNQVIPTMRRATSYLPWLARRPSAATTSTESKVPLAAGSRVPASRRIPADGSDAERHLKPETISPASGAAIASDSETPQRTQPLPRFAATLRPGGWKMIVVLIYFVGFAFLLVRLLMGLWWARRLSESAPQISEKYFLRKDEAEDARTHAVFMLLASLSSQAGLHRPPLLKESVLLSVPATVGLRHRVILLPAGWRTWTDDKLRAVLAHEISHVARRDAWTQILALLHRAIFWFSPLSWWLNRRLIELAEQASDEAALAGGADRLLYAETLLGFFARLQSAPGRVRWQALSMANRVAGRGERRVDRILAWKGPMVTKRSLVVGLMVFAVPAIFLVASLRPFVADAKGQPSAKSPAQPSARSAAVTATSTWAADANHSPAPHSPGPSANAAAQGQQDDNQSRETGRHVKSAGDFWGPRYVIMSSNGRDVSMSGNVEDLMHVRALSQQIKGDFIWFEQGGKSYVITDPAFIQQARGLFAPQEELGRKQDELGRQQDELGRQQDALGEKMEKARVQVPDISPDLERIRARLKELEASGATQTQLGRIQSEIGELQGRLGRLQSQAGRQQSEIGRQQGELGQRQGELGRQQGELGRRQGEIARQASQQLRRMFEDAISRGIAKPE